MPSPVHVVVTEARSAAEPLIALCGAKVDGAYVRSLHPYGRDVRHVCRECRERVPPPAPKLPN